ncbi:hypothetical protein [Candidatus Nitrospira nitrificans]|uniref:Lipoprotein n=1 Tax=Candidatus Nitrospira nitrificans TaxID=1742973 RepID=A0A0S4LR65_9BACT|nr:hypothetical protein [Candidatus Nitrospira nitrificans]CUS39048.1 conserved exported hypothetical protein [Candidatus Nitrospira nitrificans]
MHGKRMTMLVFGLLFLTSLSACSGEGETSPPSPAPLAATSAEGLWTGTTNTNRTVAGVVLDDGVYWVLYSSVNDPSTVAGLIQGESSSQHGAFTSPNARDFNVEGQGILNATINGTYTMKQSLSGTIAYQVGGPSTSFTTTYDNNYDLTPDISAVAGTYTGPITATETVTAQVSPNGNISGSSNTGCTFTGSFSPRTHGNVFNITVTFEDDPACSNRNDTVNGIGFYDAGTKTLTSTALNSARTNGFVFIGTKP